MFVFEYRFKLRPADFSLPHPQWWVNRIRKEPSTARMHGYRQLTNAVAAISYLGAFSLFLALSRARYRPVALQTSYVAVIRL